MTDNEKQALDALNLAYAVLLGMPYGEYRAKHQITLASVRDAIAVLTGKDAEAVQNEYESLVAFFEPQSAAG